MPGGAGWDCENSGSRRRRCPPDGCGAANLSLRNLSAFDLTPAMAEDATNRGPWSLIDSTDHSFPKHTWSVDGATPHNRWQGPVSLEEVQLENIPTHFRCGFFALVTRCGLRSNRAD